ncbi:hypothetical protein PPACK8108_LOCUS24709 [Phakopsora pachyrhizi]|uniref:Uncharacterized protein n=1 Tax=Phakopsora pachyrhizi TaxID=170000 RepID=A0AAV0BR63_PHAPC|nr:hypothetical protein PPACK8108_LOCUS24709 [Phakopsora pachyrhizi]
MDNSNLDGTDKKPFPTEEEPLIPQPSSSTAPAPVPNPDRPRTVRHHRRTLSGRSIRGGHIQFGPSFRPNIYPAVHDPFSRQSKRAADRRARSRFFKALITGIGLWLVLGLVLGWTGLRRSDWGQDNNRLDYGAKPSVPRSEGHPVTCAKFSSPRSVKVSNTRMPGDTKKSWAHFDFPLPDGQSFFIHGQGSFAKGHIYLDTTPSDSVKIEVEALYNDDALIDLMTVCQVEADSTVNSKAVGDESFSRFSKGRKIGLGFYTPSPEVGPYPNSDLEFRVRVQLPSYLKSMFDFEVRGELFAVQARDLSAIAIDQFDVESTVASISIEKISSPSVRIRTHNGQIEGFFNISKSLSLTTVNGAITSRVALFPPTKHDRELPDLPPYKYNGSQSAAAVHFNDVLSKYPSATSVHVTTINGAASVDYVEHPLDMKLFSYVDSTNGRAHVKHSPKYEGDFEVETTWGSIDIRGPESNRDPSGNGRSRYKVISTDRDELGYRQVAGSIWWGKDKNLKGKPEQGDTVVKTTLGSAQIIFK